MSTSRRRSLGRGLSLTAKVWAGFIAVLMLLILVVAQGFSVRSDLDQQARQISEHIDPKARLTALLQYRFSDMYGLQTAYTAPGQASKHLAFLGAKARFVTLLESLDSMTTTSEEKALLSEIRDGYKKFIVIDDKIWAAVQAGRTTQASAMSNDDEAPTYAQSMTASSKYDVLVSQQRAAAMSKFVAAGNAAARNDVLTVLVAGLVAMGIALALTRSIRRPLARTVAVLELVAAGDLTQRMGEDRRDEIGRMSSALDEALERMCQTLRGISTSTLEVSEAAQELTGVAQTLERNASDTSDRVLEVSGAAGRVSADLRAVAGGAVEMSSAINEISRSTSQAASVTDTAVSVVEAASTTVTRLGGSSAEVGKVVKTITSIAEQTNLLALNATIEAARAGSAGKGFAVVAGEVKELAQETARATEDISRRVEAIQADTQSAVTAIEQIADVIARIDEGQATIAAAVEEQTATTEEMNRGVSCAADGSTQIAQAIGGVESAARTSQDSAERSGLAAERLARMSGDLRRLVDQFSY